LSIVPEECVSLARDAEILSSTRDLRVQEEQEEKLLEEVRLEIAKILVRASSPSNAGKRISKVFIDGETLGNRLSLIEQARRRQTKKYIGESLSRKDEIFTFRITSKYSLDLEPEKYARSFDWTPVVCVTYQTYKAGGGAERIIYRFYRMDGKKMDFKGLLENARKAGLIDRFAVTDDRALAECLSGGMEEKLVRTLNYFANEFEREEYSASRGEIIPAIAAGKLSETSEAESWSAKREHRGLSDEEAQFLTGKITALEKRLEKMFRKKSFSKNHGSALLVLKRLQRMAARGEIMKWDAAILGDENNALMLAGHDICLPADWLEDPEQLRARRSLAGKYLEELKKGEKELKREYVRQLRLIRKYGDKETAVLIKERIRETEGRLESVKARRLETQREYSRLGKLAEITGKISSNFEEILFYAGYTALFGKGDLKVYEGVSRKIFGKKNPLKKHLRNYVDLGSGASFGTILLRFARKAVDEIPSILKGVLLTGGVYLFINFTAADILSHVSFFMFRSLVLFDISYYPSAVAVFLSASSLIIGYLFVKTMEKLSLKARFRDAVTGVPLFKGARLARYVALLAVIFLL
ncbi:MAG TPA: hypothetical protein VJC03_08140, partial [bacterium]|nr:hypothetical protein [bacterium]